MGWGGGVGRGGGVGGNFKREGTYASLWLIHITVWQKPTQHYKAIILQSKIQTFFKKVRQSLSARGLIIWTEQNQTTWVTWGMASQTAWYQRVEEVGTNSRQRFKKKHNTLRGLAKAFLFWPIHTSQISSSTTFFLAVIKEFEALNSQSTKDVHHRQGYKSRTAVFMFILRTGLICPHHYQKTPNSFVSLKGQKKSSRDGNINVLFWLGLTLRMFGNNSNNKKAWKFQRGVVKGEKFCL